MCIKYKMKKKDKKKIIELHIEIPEGVEVNIENDTVMVKGKNGEISRKIPINHVNISKKDNGIALSCDSKRKMDKAILGTTRAHIQNMIKGVSEGVVYKMKIVYSHFPMSVKVQGNNLTIENFFGERYPRKADILGGVNVDIKGHDITVMGFEKEKVSQTAANIEQATKIKGRDRRVFQDGCYIIEKDGKPMVK